MFIAFFPFIRLSTTLAHQFWKELTFLHMKVAGRRSGMYFNWGEGYRRSICSHRRTGNKGCFEKLSINRGFCFMCSCLKQPICRCTLAWLVTKNFCRWARMCSTFYVIIEVKTDTAEKGHWRIARLRSFILIVSFDRGRGGLRAVSYDGVSHSLVIPISVGLSFTLEVCFRNTVL